MTDLATSKEDSSESAKERVDRELIEMLNELRVALPGVQVLFAFLLTVPFSQHFADTTGYQRAMYYASLVASAVATGLLIAPAAQHRVLSASTTRNTCSRAPTGTPWQE